MKEMLRNLPKKTGVYFFINEEGTVIYIGKAKSIRKRVASHFRKGTRRSFSRIKAKVPPKRIIIPSSTTRRKQLQKQFYPRMYNKIKRKREKIINQTSSISYILTSNEEEALTLESYLISLFRPAINKAIARFPFIEITIGEAIPRVLTNYQPLLEDSIILGPIHHTADIDQAIEGFLTIIPICNSLHPVIANGRLKEPCLRYYMHRCIAPCRNNKKNLEHYQNQVDRFINEFNNEGRGIIKKLKKKMQKAATEENFEGATIIRNRIRAIEELFDKKSIPNILSKFRLSLLQIFKENSPYIEKVDKIIAQTEKN
ncbi:MAG: hypothetical protein GF308_02020 [Candidatus Heimdallarchaeota archaeon]|nr:hypothetical protein [Candidatus Heimdallarchaeota archaeon]